MSATLQCADVGSTPEPDLPDGVEIKINEIEVTPSDGFELSSESCPGDAPACTSDSFRLTASSRCSVAVAWKGSDSSRAGTLKVTRQVRLSGRPGRRTATPSATRSSSAGPDHRATSKDDSVRDEERHRRERDRRDRQRRD